MRPVEKGVIGYDATSLEIARRSGVSQYTARLLKGLIQQRDGWDYVLLHGKRLLGKIPEGALSGTWPRLPNKTLWMQFLLPLILARLRPTLCHFTNSLAPLRISCPYIVTIHDMSLVLHRDFHTRRNIWAVRSLLPSVARRARAVVTVSESSKRDIVRLLNIPADKITVIHEAAGEEFGVVHQASELQRVADAHALHEPFILSVSNIEPRKNLIRLLSAYAALRRRGHRERLVFVGQLAWKYKGLLAAIERLGLEDRVQIMGYVPDADMPAIYNLAKVLAFPSLYEGFGLPIVESMACGTPVLTSDCSSMPEIAGDAALLTDPRSEEDLQESLHRILSDEQLREGLRLAGLRRARQFSWARAASETVRLYDYIAAGSECFDRITGSA